MSHANPRVLIIGAGAVGQVYGRHLQLGGASVTYFVKEKYLDSLGQGMPLYPLNKQRVSEEACLFTDYSLLTSIEEVKTKEFDQVWLCVDATALRRDWVETMCTSIGSATVISLISGIHEKEILLKYIPEARLVCGIITLISYQAPLPNEVCQGKGMAYWFPPFTPAYFSGPTLQVRTIVSILKSGGQPAAIHKDISAMSSFGTAVLMPLLLGLERSSWSFKQFSSGLALTESLKAVREALQIAAQQTDRPLPFFRHFIGPFSIKVILWLGERILPLPLESYLKYHFTKVGAQTHLFINNFIRIGEERGLPTSHLWSLKESMSIAKK
jgi:hypothetical protein